MTLWNSVFNSTISLHCKKGLNIMKSFFVLLLMPYTYSFLTLKPSWQSFAIKICHLIGDSDGWPKYLLMFHQCLYPFRSWPYCLHEMGACVFSHLLFLRDFMPLMAKWVTSWWKCVSVRSVAKTRCIMWFSRYVFTVY